MNLNLALILGTAGICCLGSAAGVPDKLSFCNTDEERVLLNDTSSLETARTTPVGFALSVSDLPEDTPWSLEILKKAGINGFWRMSFPATQVAMVEYFYQVAAADKPAKLIFQIGDYETYNQTIEDLKPGESGKWIKFTFNDKRVRNLNSIRWRTEPDDAAFHLRLAGVNLITPGGEKIPALKPGPERFFGKFNIPGDFDYTDEAPDLQGKIIIGFAGGLCTRKDWRNLIYEMKKLVPNLAIGPVWGFQEAMKFRDEFVRHGIPLVYQSNESNDIDDYLAWHKAMGTNSRGSSRNQNFDRSTWSPGEWFHGGDYGHEALFDAQTVIIDRLAQIGIKENLFMDAAWWEDTSAGFSEADRVTFIHYLEGNHKGLAWVNADGQTTELKFIDYFEHNFGLRPTPADLGLGSFAEFKAPMHQPAANDPATRKYTYAVFFALKRYAMLDFYSRLGKYGNTKNVKVTCMPLNCSAFGQGMARTDALQSLNFDFEDTSSFFHPYIGEFGTPEFSSGDGGCIALFSRGPVWRELRKLAGKRYWAINESGGGGQCAPYRDPRINYLLQYANSAIMQPEVYHCDFLDSWTPAGLPTWEKMNDPKQKFHYSRFVDMLWAMSAYNSAVSEKAQLPANIGEIVSLVRSADTFFLPRHHGSLGKIAGERLHYPYLAMSPDQVRLPVFDKCRVLFYEMRGHTPAQIEWISKFLDNSPERSVILDGPAVGHRFDGADLLPVRTGEDFSINAPGAFKALGIDRVSVAPQNLSGKLRTAAEFPTKTVPDRTFQYSGNYYSFEGAAVKPVLSIDEKPILSMLPTASGATVYLLHYLSEGAGNTRRLDEFVAEAILTRHQVKPNFTGGRELIALPMDLPLAQDQHGKIVFAHDNRKLSEYVYSGNNASSYYGYDTDFGPQTLTAPGLGGKQIVYDFLTGNPPQVIDSPQVELTLAGKSGAMWYLLPDTPAGRDKLSELMKRRNQLGAYLNPEVISYLNTRKE